MLLFKRYSIKVILWVFMGCLCCVPTIWGADEPAQENAEKKAGEPQIKFDKKIHDFGKSFQNASLKHTFTFKNVGQGLLVIEKVKAG